jgi:hypothetical protein
MNEIQKVHKCMDNQHCEGGLPGTSQEVEHPFLSMTAQQSPEKFILAGVIIVTLNHRGTVLEHRNEEGEQTKVGDGGVLSEGPGNVVNLDRGYGVPLASIDLTCMITGGFLARQRIHAVSSAKIVLSEYSSGWADLRTRKGTLPCPRGQGQAGGRSCPLQSPLSPRVQEERGKITALPCRSV